MKKLLLFILLSGILSCPLQAQRRNSEEPGAQDGFAGKNSIYGGFSLGSHYGYCINVTTSVEYHRHITNNLYWSVGYSYKQSNDGLRPDEEGLQFDMKNNFLSGMVHYRIPIVKNRLYLCAGAGIALGYHHMSERTLRDTDLTHKLLPYFNLDVYWLFRMKWGGEIRIGPLSTFILNARGGTWKAIPYRMSYSPWSINDELGFPSRTRFYEYLHVSLGYRF